jgi:hypothetical protein
MEGGGLEPHIPVKVELAGGIGEKKSNGGTQHFQNKRIYNTDGVNPALTSQLPGGGKPHSREMFGIDYNIGGVERPIANTIKARYDAGVTNFKQDGTAVCIKIK